MTPEEEELSRSTPGYRFDVAPTPKPVEENKKHVALNPEAVKEVQAIIDDKDNKVVMFALKWCEFCWSVRKVLAEYKIPYQSIDLDAVEYQDNERGAKMRAALADKTTWNTFPQIFIDGEFVGGCTDIFDGIIDKSIIEKLEKSQVEFKPEVELDPYSLLPSWLHPR